MLKALDPIQADGEVFDFISDDVPGPNDVVDLAVTWQRARADAKRCEVILRNNPSLSKLLWVFRNTILWCRFWSVRGRDEEEREYFKEQLGLALTDARELEEKAWAKQYIVAIETLSDLNLIEDKRE